MKKIKNNLPYLFVTFFAILIIDNFIDICFHQPIEWGVNLLFATLIPLFVITFHKK